MSDKLLTFATATYEDAAGAYFTLRSLRAHHGWDFEILVLDNAPARCGRTAAAAHAAGGTYLHRPDLSGTARSRDALFHFAKTPWVAVVDSHVLFEPGSVAALADYVRKNPDSNDLLQGPIVWDNGHAGATHWGRTDASKALWGVWQMDPRAAWTEKSGPGPTFSPEPFEIPMQGLGFWCMRKAAWPGFNRHMRGFGGEEGYLHEKVRQRGGKALCLPDVRWTHWFRDTAGWGAAAIPYKPSPADHARNLLLGHRELGIDAREEIKRDFGARLPAGLFEKLEAEATTLQPLGIHDVRPKLKVLGVWYSNNTAPPKLLADSLRTVKDAADQSRHAVEVVTVVYSPVAGNPFTELDAAQKTSNHEAIAKQIKQGIEAGSPETEIVCFLEHDVLYPASYFDAIGDAFAGAPAATTLVNLDYEGLNATGWLAVRERHEPMHQMAMRRSAALANLDRALADCAEQGWAYLEPDSAVASKDGRTVVTSDRSGWLRAQPTGLCPAVHVNHTTGRLTSHGEVVYHQDAAGRIVHPYWGKSADWWPEPPVTAAAPSGGCGCGQPQTEGAKTLPVVRAPSAGRVTSRPTPKRADYDTVEAWFAAGGGRTFGTHMATLKELADKCKAVAEVSAWQKTALIALAASKAETVVSYATKPRPEWAQLAGIRPGFTGVPFEGETADVEPADLLFVDTRHTYERVRAELAAYAPKVSRFIVFHTVEKFGRVGEDKGIGVMPAIVTFMANNSEWSVLKYDSTDFGLVVLGKDPADKPPLPSKAKMMWNYARSKVKSTWNGGKLLPLAMAEDRMAECWTCEKRSNDRCSACGCWLTQIPENAPGVPEKMWGAPGKTRIPTEACPIGRWLPIKNFTPDPDE